METDIINKYCYIIQMHYTRKDYYLAWTGEYDNLFVRNGSILIYRSLEECINKLHLQGWIIDEDIVPFDFDEIIEWCNSTMLLKDYSKIMDTWNMLSDISKAANRPFCGDSKCKAINTVYNKIFYCIDIPAHHDSRAGSIIWSDTEINLVKNVLLHGKYLLDKLIK